jgi:hypothetical protein
LCFSRAESYGSSSFKKSQPSDEGDSARPTSGISSLSELKNIFLVDEDVTA